MKFNNKYKKIIALAICLSTFNNINSELFQGNLITESQAASYAPRKCSARVRFLKSTPLKKGTSTKGTSTLLTIPYGTVLTVSMETPAWYKISYGGKTGWVLKNATTLAATGTSYTASIVTTANVNLRPDVHSSTKVLDVIPKDTKLTTSAKTSSWFRVSYTNPKTKTTRTGWIYRTCTKGGEEAKTVGRTCNDIVRTTANLHLRKEASSNTTSLIVIPKGTKLTTQKQTDNWFKVSYTNTNTKKTYTGWIFKTYTEIISPGSSSSSNTQLRKPNYNIKSFNLTGYTAQTNSEVNLRWSDDASSDSLGKIPKGGKVTLLKDSIHTYWYLAKYKDIEGWVSKKYINILTPVITNPKYKEIIKPSSVTLAKKGDVFDESKPKPTKEAVLKMIDKYAAKYGVPAHIFKGIVQAESNFNHQCVSHTGAVGLIQLMVEPATEMGLTVSSTIDERWDPEKNIEAGIKYITKCYNTLNRQFPDTRKNNESDWDKAFAAYNGGPSLVKDAKGNIPNSSEIRDYVAKVNDYKENYRKK